MADDTRLRRRRLTYLAAILLGAILQAGSSIVQATPELEADIVVEIDELLDFIPNEPDTGGLGIEDLEGGNIEDGHEEPQSTPTPSHPCEDAAAEEDASCREGGCDTSQALCNEDCSTNNTYPAEIEACQRGCSNDHSDCREEEDQVCAERADEAYMACIGTLA